MSLPAPVMENNSTDSPVLESVGLIAGYGSVPAIVDVGIEVGAGEMVALLGANGAGKTTTILALAGALRPMGGEVRMYGRTDRRPMARRVRDGLALLPEKRAVFMGLSVRDNLALGRGEIDKALALFPELERRLSVRAGLTSGGEQQMIGLARILAAEPRVILVDEMSLGLAPAVVRRLLEALSAAASAGAAVILVEQHPRTAIRWTDRAYVLRRGRVELTGKRDDLLTRMDELTSLYL